MRDSRDPRDLGSLVRGRPLVEVRAAAAAASARQVAPAS